MPPHAHRHSPHGQMGLGHPLRIAPCIAVVHQPGRPAQSARLLEDCQVVTIAVQRDFVRRLLDVDPVAIVVDHVGTELDVVRVCRDISAATTTRVMVISSSVEADVRAHVDMLDAGADDVVASATNSEIVRARVRSMVRSAAARTRLVHVQLGDLCIDLEAHLVHIGGRLIACPHLQFRLLTLLACRPNRLITRDEIVTTLWGREESHFPGKARVVVSALRRSIREADAVPTIEVVSKLGYRLVVSPVMADVSWMTTSDGRRIPIPIA